MLLVDYWLLHPILILTFPVNSTTAMENKCLRNPCTNGGSCVQTMSGTGYECHCPSGYRGQDCEGVLCRTRRTILLPFLFLFQLTRVVYQKYVSLLCGCFCQRQQHRQSILHLSSYIYNNLELEN